ncbi:unnamed protein product [Phytomonas sp. EM1]|nr:unnamed protein product [Phytomonas sp. EM1]|eukprot:CCW64124.1 unnamed protein product [Phytomonas sp. isolate EM1]
MLGCPADETFSSLHLHCSTTIPSFSTDGSALANSVITAAQRSPEFDNQLTNPDRPDGPKESAKTVYDYQVLDSNQELYDLAQHRGQVLLICNVATRCKEYAEKAFTILNTLQHRYHDRGFTVLAFPCKQFGTSELGGEEEVAQTVSSLYPGIGDITFPILSRVDVNGSYESPLYTYLKSCLKGTMRQTSIKWNFTYFLINRQGVPVARLPPETEMEDMEARVKEALGIPSSQNS